MVDNPNKPKPVKVDGTEKKTAVHGPDRGGNRFNQTVFGKQNTFVVHSPIKGHTQKSNIEPPKTQK